MKDDPILEPDDLFFERMRSLNCPDDRAPMPDDARDKMPLVKAFLAMADALGYNHMGYESDDGISEAHSDLGRMERALKFGPLIEERQLKGVMSWDFVRSMKASSKLMTDMLAYQVLNYAPSYPEIFK